MVHFDICWAGMVDFTVVAIIGWVGALDWDVVWWVWGPTVPEIGVGIGVGEVSKSWGITRWLFLFWFMFVWGTGGGL